MNHIPKEFFSHLPPPPSGTPPPKRRRIKIVSLDHLIHYHPVINTFSSSLYTFILKIPVSLLHISSISGEIYFVIWRSFYYSFSKKSGKFLQERIVGERLHVWIAYNFVIYILWRGAIAYYFLGGFTRAFGKNNITIVPTPFFHYKET